MTSKVELVGVRGDLEQHPAFLAWSELRPEASPPRRIDSFRSAKVERKGKKALAYRLYPADPAAEPVIAKRCRRSTAELERTIYRRLLPAIPVSSLCFHGSVTDRHDADRVWIFLEDAGEERWHATDEHHRLLAAGWLARLHGAGAQQDLGALPDRGVADYRVRLEVAWSQVTSVHGGPDIAEPEREVVGEIARQLGLVREHWDAIEEVCRSVPQALVHNDFIAKNVRLRAGADGCLRLLPFDWGTAGRGTPASDLAGVTFRCDQRARSEYIGVLRRYGVDVTDRQMARLHACGRLLRLALAIYWETLAVGTRYSTLASPRMRQYLLELHTLVGTTFGDLRSGEVTAGRDTAPRAGGSAVTGGSPGISAGRDSTPRSSDLSSRLPSDERLQSMLESMLEDYESVRILSRERNRYTSTSPSEIVTVRLGDAGETQLFNKYFFSDLIAAGARSSNPFNEARMYREVLGPPHTLPRAFGTWIDETRGEAWLVLEHLAEARRLIHVTKQQAAIEEAASWIGRFHRDAARRVEEPALGFLRRLDAEYFRGRLRRVTAAVDVVSCDDLRWLKRLEDRFDVAVAALAASPPTVIHAEYYPKNILVVDGSVYPIDWETASIGAGEIDLAMLLSGWKPAVVDRCLEAYAAAREATGPEAELRRRVEIAGLLVGVNWLAHGLAEGSLDERQEASRAWMQQVRRGGASLEID